MTDDLPAVLLVDDRPENLLALRATLEPLNCRTVEVTSGEAALKALLQDEFAVVLLDVQMPGMDGFETAELIKGRERTRTVPIIFVTAISKESHHVFRGYEAGAVDYLFKPYDPELLKSKVRVFIELDAKSRAAARSQALLRAAFDYAPIGMARLDGEGRFAEVNRSFAALLGHTPGELRDRLLDSVVHAEDRAAVSRPEDGGEREARMIASGGEALPCLLTFSVADPGGRLPPALIMQVEDLRPRRRAELEREHRIREQIARNDAERASSVLRSLQDISDAAMGTLVLDELVGKLLDSTARALAVDTAAIMIVEDDQTTVTHQVAGANSEQRWYSVVSGEKGDDDDASPLGDRIASALTVPLAAGGETIGLLHVGTLFERRFSEEEHHLLRLAADRAALAIQRARMHQRDRAITEELQRSLLPAELPRVRGTVTASRYQPGGLGERVGGDWYDAVLQSEDRLLLIIGDVAGHGIRAATAMGQLRSVLRAYALDGHAPAALLERLNAYQLGVQMGGMTTLALVRVDLRRQRVTYASAGHLPPLVVGGDGEQRWLDGALGPPLGAVDGMAYAEQQADLGPDATIVMYTDGLVELRGESLDRGLERLQAALKGAPEDPEELCDRILERTLVVDVAEDDVTLLVLRAVPERRRNDRRRTPRTAAVPEPVPPADPPRQLATNRWPHAPLRSARVELPRGPQAGAAARRVLTDTLTGTVSTTELVDLHAVVSEVVNNAVVHGVDGDEGMVVVHLAAGEDVVRLEITNDGAPFDPPPPSAQDEPGGFGLGIVEDLTSRWGLDFEADGVCVWFELDRVRD